VWPSRGRQASSGHFASRLEFVKLARAGYWSSQEFRQPQQISA
jgi:hypothetical protein